MRSLLVKHDLEIAIEGKEKKPTAMSDENWTKTDEKAMAEIFLSLSINANGMYCKFILFLINIIPLFLVWT